LLQVVPRVTCDVEFDKELLNAFTSLSFRATEAKSYRTICVDITPSLEVIRKSFDKKWRNQLNASEKLDIKVESSHELRDFEQFLSLYDAMLDRKQFDSSVDPREFVRVNERLSKGNRFLILRALHDDALVACLVIAAQPDTAIYLLGASNDQGRTLKASYLLHWRAITELKALGCAWYDLGGIDPDENPGGFRFKSGFGGIDVSQVSSHIAGPNPWIKLLSLYLKWKSRRAKVNRPKDGQ